MIQITGSYQHERDENMEEFYQALGNVDIRTIGMLNSKLEITRNADEWIIKAVTNDETKISVFTLDVDYKEIMPSGGELECITCREGNTFITISTTEGGTVIIRKYEFDEYGVLLKMRIVGKRQSAIRYFKKENVSGISPGTLTKIALGATGAAVGGGLAVAAAPIVIAAAGFTSAGIAAGSVAASMMSMFGGGATAAGGVIATLQSVGALGTVLGSSAATAAAVGTGAAAGVAVGTGVGHLAVRDK